MNGQSFAVLPYIKGITEPLTRILKSHDIRVTNKPIKTLQQEFPVPKFRPQVDDQCDVVYKIPCASCPWRYIGETKRSFSTRQKEHIRNTKQCAKGSNVAKHAWTLDHAIDFENAEIIDKGNNRIRKTLESWHTAKTVEADNNSFKGMRDNLTSILDEDLSSHCLCALHCEMRNTEQLLKSVGLLAYEIGSLPECNAALSNYGPENFTGDRIKVKLKHGQKTAAGRNNIKCASCSERTERQILNDIEGIVDKSLPRSKL
ncbi:hypothetical protein ACROYT_G014695 [Oculina patagonica]